MKAAYSVLLSLLIAGCATKPAAVPFQVQFDHYFPDDRGRDWRPGDPPWMNISMMYRDAYQKVMAAPQSHGDLGLASTGDAAALRRYLLRATTGAGQLDGGRGEDYTHDLVFLLIRTGDLSFSSALRTLSREERERVGANLDPAISSDRAWFPLTVSSYEYRWQKRGPAPMAERYR